MRSTYENSRGGDRDADGAVRRRHGRCEEILVGGFTQNAKDQFGRDPKFGLENKDLYGRTDLFVRNIQRDSYEMVYSSFDTAFSSQRAFLDIIGGFFTSTVMALVGVLAARWGSDESEERIQYEMTSRQSEKTPRPDPLGGAL